jgi:hypothetical protein
MASASSPTDELASLPQRFGAAWNRFWFAPADAFPLAVLRVLTGLMTIYVLATLTPDLVRFFGPGGLVPVDVVRALRAPSPDAPAMPSTAVSLLEMVISPAELYAVHALALAVAVLFTIGFYSRVTAILTLIVVLSYIHRGPMLTTQMEHVLSMLLLYVSWSPCGEFLSIDAWRRRRGPVAAAELAERQARASVTANVAVRLIQVHLTIIYLMMALAKINDGAAVEGGTYHAWWDGEAAWWLAAKPGASLVDLTGILGWSVVLTNLWTLAIVAFELGFVVFVWIPATRPLMLAIAVPMWLSLAVLTGLTPFCLMMLIANLAFSRPETLRSWMTRIGGLRTAAK